MTKEQARRAQSVIGIAVMGFVMFLAASGYRPGLQLAVVVAAVAIGNIAWVVWTSARYSRNRQD